MLKNISKDLVLSIVLDAITKKMEKVIFRLIQPHSTIVIKVSCSNTLNATLYFSSQACDLLGNFMEQINQDYHKAFKIYQTACDEYKFGHSCQRVGSYLFAGKSVERDVVRYQTNRSYSIRQSQY